MNKSLAGLLFLIVDDEMAIREAMGFHLAKQGAQLLEAENGIDALRIASEGKPDVIISDVHMPGENADGVSFFLKVKELTPYRPIFILITGFAKIQREEALRLGVSEFLEKPFKFDVLEKTIKRLLGKRLEVQA